MWYYLVGHRWPWGVGGRGSGAERPPYFSPWVARRCRCVPVFLHRSLLHPPHAYWSHPYQLFRCPTAPVILVYVAYAYSALFPRPSPFRYLVITPWWFADPPPRSLFMPTVHSFCTSEESLQVLGSCVGYNRRCVQWLRRVRSVLTIFFSLLRLLQHTSSSHCVLHVSRICMLCCTMLI